MSRFLNNTGSSKVDEAIEMANENLRISSFLIMAIKNKNDFKFNSGGGYNIAFTLLFNDTPMIIKTYRPKWPWSSAIGTYKNGVHSINVYKIEKMSVRDIASNICHEYAHHCGFKHGNNYKTKEKCLYSVPYFISEFVNNKELK